MRTSSCEERLRSALQEGSSSAFDEETVCCRSVLKGGLDVVLCQVWSGGDTGCSRRPVEPRQWMMEVGKEMIRLEMKSRCIANTDAVVFTNCRRERLRR